jgi:amino-acid N-acetyltransferase
MITYTFADKIDLENIANILKKNDLPFSDLQESPVDFILAKKKLDIYGCIGLEKYGTEGLLRSFVIDPEYRKKGIGKTLYNHMLAYAVQNKIKTLHLLTTTAKDYFLNTGFSVKDRSIAPKIIQDTVEFKSLCPASSTYMALEMYSKPLDADLTQNTGLTVDQKKVIKL